MNKGLKGLGQHEGEYLMTEISFLGDPLIAKLSAFKLSSYKNNCLLCSKCELYISILVRP